MLSETQMDLIGTQRNENVKQFGNENKYVLNHILTETFASYITA